VVPPQKSIFCGADFGDGSSTEIKALPTFFSRRNGNTIFAWNLYLFCAVQKFSSLNFHDFKRFCRFIFRSYTFSYGTVLTSSKVSSSCRFD